MPFIIPTLSELNQQAKQDIVNSGIAGVNITLRYSILNTLATSQAGLSWQHFSYLKEVAKQSVPWTATGEYLAGWGSLKNVFQKASSLASGEVSFKILSGVTVPAGTLLKREDGWEYITLSDSVDAKSPIQSVKTGTAGNAAINTPLLLANSIAGVDPNVTITTALTGGADPENEDNFRSRALQSYRTSGSNGREQEYINWAQTVPQVSRAWVDRNGFGAGSVIILIMCDEANQSNNGFPVGQDGCAIREKRYYTATGDQLTVANYIYDKQPVTALVIVCSPLAQPVDFVIADLGKNNTKSNQALISQALQDMFRRDTSPGNIMHPSAWDKAISSLTGLTQYNITTPSEPVKPNSSGHLLTLGNVIFQS